MRVSRWHTRIPRKGNPHMFKSARSLITALATGATLVFSASVVAPAGNVPIVEHVAPQSASAALPVKPVSAQALASHWSADRLSPYATFVDRANKWFVMSRNGSVYINVRTACRSGATAVTARVFNPATHAYHGGTAVIPCTGVRVSHTFHHVPAGANRLEYKSWGYASVSGWATIQRY